MSQLILIGISIAVLFFFILVFSMFRRYKRCPSDRILVVYGRIGSDKDGTGRSSKCIHGGAAFIWPIIQDFEYLDLTPISIEVDLRSALSRQNIRVDVPSRFTVGISTEPSVMTNAAERLLGLQQSDVYDLAKDIIFGQLRLVVATMDIEEINSNRDKFLSNVTANVEAELKKIGLKLINVNVTDIKDESGYIEALGKEAAAKAINDAKKSVAEKNRDGAIGEANAHQEERVQVADANARAVTGENLAQVEIANSDAFRREKEAEALRLATAAEKVQAAKALEEAYGAEEEAENQRAIRDKATQVADVVVPAEVQKQKIEIDAEAEAENLRRIARGDADAIFARKEAEAKGIFEVLTKQAAGLDKIVEAAENNPKDAAMLIIADKLVDLVKLQSEAIKNIQIDKVTVWDNGSGGKNGKTGTADFLSGLYGSVPPLDEVFKLAGLELPGYLKGEANDTTADDVPDQGSSPEIDNDDTRAEMD